MSSILKGLNESYFNRDEQDQQNAMDTRRRSDLSGERNAGLNEPDELPTTPQQSRNGVYEYSVPTGQEKIAQELGLQLHKGHWFSRVPVQRANFQFGRPQFHEIPSKNVSEAEQDYGPEYQDKVKRLGQMAKQGERKTVWDPVKRVYKTVPVNPPKQQGVAEGFPKDPNAPKLVQDRKTGKWYDPNKEFEKKMNSPEVIAQMKRMAQKEDVAEGVAETLPMDDAVKVLRQYGADHFKTTSNELHFYKQGRPFSVDLVMNPDATRSVTLSSLNSATRGLKGQGVAEGSSGVSVRQWANQVRKDHGPDVKFRNRQEGGGAVDSVIAKNSQGETVGVYNRKTGYPTVYEPKQGVAEVKKNDKNDDHEPFNYDEWKASTVKPRKPRGYKDAEALGKAIDSEQSELRKRQQGVAEGQEEKCPHCGGAMFSEMIMNEKKDACYYKVKSRYKVWPSAYASGALVKCRKSGADSWGDGGKKNESSILEGIEQVDENLNKWFKEKWVRFGPDGKIRGDCARGDDSEGKPKCLPQSKAQNLGKKGRASAAARKRREDPNPERSGKAINVNTKKKSNEGVAEGLGKSIKRASQGWGVGATPDMVTPSGAVSAFKNMDGQRLANFVASRKDQSKPRKNSAGAFVDKVIDREMRQRGYGRVANKDEQGVAEAQLDEKWSQKYKDSINCSNPKGFSQKAHCQGKNK